MADKVVRLDALANIRHENRGDTVVLIVEGYRRGHETRVRVEISLETWDIAQIPNHLHEGATAQRDKWVNVIRSIEQSVAGR